MNYRLKVEILRKYDKQWKFARAVGVDPTFVSMIINGVRDLDSTRQKLWAEKLNLPAEILFADEG